MRALSLSRLVVVPALVALVACQGGSPTRPADSPSIALSATARSFSATAGGTDPAPQTVDVTNGGSGTLSGLSANVAYPAGDPAWLSLSLNSLTAPATLELMPQTGSLAPGSYHATVSIGSAMAGNSPRTVDVAFTVDPAPVPTIALSQITQLFTTMAGGTEPAPGTIQITNGGTGTLAGLATSVSYSPGEPTGWLSAGLDGTTAPATLTLAATIYGRTAGTYHAVASVTATGAGNSPQRVEVTLQVDPSTSYPAIALSATSVSFSATALGADPAPQTVQITNGGTGTLEWITPNSVYGSGEPPNWLTWTLSGQTAPATLELRPATGNLPPGTYHVDVFISSPVASNSPTILPVTFTVTPAAPAPAIALSTTSVGFGGVQGGSDPAAATAQVTNGGTGTLDGLGFTQLYARGEPTGWLSAALGGTTAPATLTLTPHLGTLAVGTYHATIAVTSPAAGNSPVTLAVTFKVTAPSPSIGLSASAVSFTGTQNGPPPAAKSIQIANTGGGSLTGLRATSSAAWLTAGLSSGTAPATLTLQPSPAGLAPGAHTATVDVTSPVAGNSPQTVTVTFQVAAALTAPVLQTPTLNGTTATLTWTFTWPGGLGSSNDGYLVEESASASSGYVQIANPATHQSPYSLNVTGLAPGTHYFRVRAATTQGLSPYSNVRSVTVSQPAQITLVNGLAPGGSDQVLRFRLASSLTGLTSAANTSAEQMSPDSYCGSLPGQAIGPGQSKTFDVSGFAPNYYVHIGLGIWDNSSPGGGTGCWQKKMWGVDANFNELYLFVNVAVSGQSGPVTWTLTYSGNNLVLRTPSGDIPLAASVNQDPIH